MPRRNGVPGVGTVPILVHCDCGATFDVDDRYAGRRGHCFECGRSVAVPDPAVDEEEAGAIALAPIDTSDTPSVPVRRPPADRLLPGSEPAAPTGQAPPAEKPVQTVYRHASDRDAILAPEFGFWHDALRSFYLFLDPDNLFACLFVWVLHVFLGALSYATAQPPAIPGPAIWIIPLLSLLFQLVLVSWLCGFYLDIILETARGEDALPPLAMEGNPWSDLLRPLSLFVGSWVAVLLPAGLCLAAEPLAGRAVDPLIVLGLAGLGVFFWPSTILTIAIGDSLGAIRPVLIVRTVARSFLPYLAIWVLLLAAIGLFVVPIVGITTGVLDNTPLAGLLGGGWTPYVITSVLAGYLMIVIMRIIGLYYRHFKSDFAWTAE